MHSRDLSGLWAYSDARHKGAVSKKRRWESIQPIFLLVQRSNRETPSFKRVQASLFKSVQFCRNNPKHKTKTCPRTKL